MKSTSEGGEAARSVEGLVANLFRRSAARMVSTLTRVLGPENLEMAEEVVQDALVKALQIWSFRGVPKDPEAWLYRVARNRALDRLRRSSTFDGKVEEGLITAFTERPRATPDWAQEVTDGISDDELNMIFMCCHPEIPPESQVALTLKTVGGFSVEEIASAYLAKKSTVAQRIVRAKKRLREAGIRFELPEAEELAARRDVVLKVIYLLFNEGYSAYEGEELVRVDLCGESLRLGQIVAAHPATAGPDAHALLALMLLQASRLPARTDAHGVLVRLADQDRSRWDFDLISRGLWHLEQGAEGDRLTPYHLEAGIAACHACAPSYEQTDWTGIIEFYELLATSAPNPVVTLNRAVAVAMVRGPREGLQVLEAAGRDAALAEHHLFFATRAELLERAGEPAAAAEQYRSALEVARTGPERRFLERRVAHFDRR